MEKPFGGEFPPSYLQKGQCMLFYQAWSHLYLVLGGCNLYVNKAMFRSSCPIRRQPLLIVLNFIELSGPEVDK